MKDPRIECGDLCNFHFCLVLHMPNFELQQQPKYPIVTLDTDTPIKDQRLQQLLTQYGCMTLCVRSLEGETKRGGFFFCLKKDASVNQIALESMEGELIDYFSLPNLVRFVNHVAGLMFDSEVLNFCQQKINFKQDR
ncbi:hypothetical protein [Fibrobacter sp. UWH1]|uniref:hypothetical protein n=1 Tax=Fibrobacter sp. UWH1 TaxID=1964354 RepID=UPI000B5279FF|nr:hypothetical protein [Fibrobacter sp. UWH1]OWV11641.1 hypothetical protein B7992_10270 [Fibrobacter sp. UWH1]